MNLDTIGYMWMGEFDLNTLWEFFKSGKKKLRIQKYPDTCGRASIRELGSAEGKTNSAQLDPEDYPTFVWVCFWADEDERINESQGP